MKNSNYQEKKELTLVNNASKLSQGNYRGDTYTVSPGGREGRAPDKEVRPSPYHRPALSLWFLTPKL